MNTPALKSIKNAVKKTTHDVQQAMTRKGVRCVIARSEATWQSQVKSRLLRFARNPPPNWQARARDGYDSLGAQYSPGFNRDEVQQIQIMRQINVIPAKAGIQKKHHWIPAFAGMTPRGMPYETAV